MHKKLLSNYSKITVLDDTQRSASFRSEVQLYSVNNLVAHRSSKCSLDGAVSSNIPTTLCSHQWNAKLLEKKRIFILFDGICYARVYPLWKMKGYLDHFFNILVADL